MFKISLYALRTSIKPRLCRFTYVLAGLSILMCCAGWGWNSSPECDDSNVKETVVNLYKENVSRMYGRLGGITSVVDFSLENVQTVSTFSDGKCHCTADLRTTGPQGTKTNSVDYTIKPVAGSDQVQIILGRW